MSYELLVQTHLCSAILATFPVRIRPVAVPGQTVHRLRVGDDRELTDIVRRLTECRVQLLEIRRGPDRPDRPLPAAGCQDGAPGPCTECAVLSAVDGPAARVPTGPAQAAADADHPAPVLPLRPSSGPDDRRLRGAGPSPSARASSGWDEAGTAPGAPG